MAEESDAADKSFEASARKLSDLRKKGEIVRSTDLLIGISYLGLCSCLYLFGDFIFEMTWANLYRSWGMLCVDVMPSCRPGIDDFAAVGSFSYIQIVLAFVAVSFVFVFLTLVATSGVVFTPKNVQFKLSRVSVLQNAKNKFGAKGLFEFIKSFGKLLLYSLFGYIFVLVHFDSIIGLVMFEERIALAYAFSLVLKLMFMFACVAMFFGAIDYLWQFNHFRKKNMMSRKEVRDEQKESDGDPHFKQSRMTRAREIAMTQMLKDVGDTDVVIVNPTHFAVALKWSRKPGEAPVCLAKGVDHVALKIREVAVEAGVPIFEDPPTARALYANLDLNQEIDPEFYVPVAAAIRYASEIKEKMRQKGF